MIRLVCFDVGGVLLRSRRSYPEAVLAAGLPLRLSEDAVAARFETAAAREVRQLYRTGQIREAQYLRGLSEAIGGIYTPEEMLAIRDSWLLEPHPETGELLENLHAFPGIQTALLSNTCLEHWTMIRQYPWYRFAHYGFASHEMGLAKPAPEIFREVVRVTGVAPEGILFFDDLEPNVASARECGWNGVLIDPLENPARQIRAALAYNLIQA